MTYNECNRMLIGTTLDDADAWSRKLRMESCVETIRKYTKLLSAMMLEKNKYSAMIVDPGFTVNIELTTEPPKSYGLEQTYTVMDGEYSVYTPSVNDTNTVLKKVVVEVDKSYEIEKVIFNNPATIVYWKDGDKTVVKCSENDTFNKETGLALCYMKKALGNKGRYNDEFRRWI